MQKLLAAYLANPTLKNADRVVAHSRKHPMTVCMMDALDAGLLNSAINHQKEV